MVPQFPKEKTYNYVYIYIIIYIYHDKPWNFPCQFSLEYAGLKHSHLGCSSSHSLKSWLAGGCWLRPWRKGDINRYQRDAMIITVMVIHPNLRILIMTDNACINHDKALFFNVWLTQKYGKDNTPNVSNLILSNLWPWHQHESTSRCSAKDRPPAQFRAGDLLNHWDFPVAVRLRHPSVN